MTLRLCSPLAFVSLCLLLLASWPAAAQDDAVTFLERSGLTRSVSPAAVEAWTVDVDPTPLAAHAQVLEIDLFDGQRHRIEAFDIEQRAPGDLAWRGSFKDGGQAILTVKHGLVVGVLYTPDGVYELTTSAQGQVFQKLDVNAFPPCAHEDVDVDTARNHFHDYGFDGSTRPVAPAASPVGVERNTRAPDLIEIMVIYTPQARNGAGGTAQIEATAQSSIDVSNTAFANSQTNAQFTLVHTAQVAYNDSGNIRNDRNWAQADPTVNALRDQYAADLVGLLVENGGGGCGVAFLMGNESAAGFAPFGYQVTARSCAVGNLSYPHEHGHNMGLQHNPQNGAPQSQAYRNYAYGHYNNGNYRTVMSYSNPCSSGCTRRPYFSNPNVVFQGAATGIANQRENARVIDEVAPFTANYRSGGGGGGGTCNGTNCIDWSSTGTVSFANQDSDGNVTVLDGGDTLLLQDNTWRRTTQTFSVTANTVVEFDFRSTSQGEIHGIGLDEDNVLSSDRIFKVHGTQNYGITNFDNYSGGTQSYSIPVGQFYTGASMSLVLVNDNDAGSGNDSYFTNVRVFEAGSGGGGSCAIDTGFESGATGWTTGGDCSTGTFVVGTPSQQTSTVVTQVGGAHGGSNALYTASNSSAGNADVDGGTCILTSPSISVGDASTLEVWYFHGQRDTGDDAGDFFRLELSTNDGTTYTPIVNIGDVRTVAQWTQVTAAVPSGSDVRVRVQVADGPSTGDIVEGGIDDLSICPN